MSDNSTCPLLDIRNLRISFATPQGRNEAVRGINLQMGRERIAVVGESGSGKSISFRSLLGLLPPSATLAADKLALQGQDLLAIQPRALRQLRGRRIGMVVQDPKQGLDPLMTIGKQLAEMLTVHRVVPPAKAHARVLELLAEVHIREPERVAKLYPHEVSGGMAQRAMVAMMLSAQPDLLIADEATSALDALVRHRILDLIDEQVRQRGMGLVLISHDLDLVARYADRILVMYAGRIVEELAGNQLQHATHPYTQGLLACRPSLKHLGGDLPVLQREATWLQ
ncbi:ABC transporter ATP-binding protein [Comamonas sp. J-3]|uniref:ABC transporter ATP-binding protein n=1 Tax=Comamonas trifloxystrobinivorans TaxID=3350256 RepID=UPI00372B14A3